MNLLGLLRPFLVLCALTAAARPGMADVIVAPMTPYVFDTSKNLYVTDSSTTNVDTGTGFVAFNLAASISNPATANILYFDLYSSSTFTGTGRLIASVAVKNSNGDFVAMPIAFASGSACSSTYCQNTAVVGGATYFFGAKFPDGLESAKTPLRIGIYLKDICTLTGTLPSACAGVSSLNTPTSATRVSVNMRFQIALLTLDATGVPDVSVGEKSEDFTTIIKTGVPTVACPGTYGDVYFPGDSSISFFPSLAFTSTTPETGSSAPIDTVIVAGRTPANASSAPNNSTFATYSLVHRVPISLGTYDMGGFRNTTNGSDNVYSIYFSARDVSGAFSGFSTSCAIHTVQTSQIQGFLKKGNCFIATAAHADPDAAGVRVLRSFRDQVLTQSKLGRTFVRLYYSNSPKFAEWLMENPVFRIPVLRVLSGIELLAAIFLSPGLAFALFVAAIAVMGYRPRRSI